MSRLTSELQRLYLLPDATGPALVDAAAQVRALVLELARPADWAALSALWQGVQADLGWPAPAIAVSGSDGFQLWLSLQQPMGTAQAADWLAALRRRYLADVAPHRLRLWPAADGHLPPPALVPAVQADDEHWSAFVAPGLAPVFSETPWLDGPPGDDGQAELLSRLLCITPAQLDDARALLMPAADAPPQAGAVSRSGQAQAADQPVAVATTPKPGVLPLLSAAAPVAPVAPVASVASVASVAPPGGYQDPRRFLLDVMNNEAVDLALRIEAARALLLPPGNH